MAQLPISDFRFFRDLEVEIFVSFKSGNEEVSGVLDLNYYNSTLLNGTIFPATSSNVHIVIYFCISLAYASDNCMAIK